MEKDQNGKCQVAVVGSGMAGLVTAYLLNRDPEQRYNVEVFELVNPQSDLCPICNDLLRIFLRGSTCLSTPVRCLSRTLRVETSIVLIFQCVRLQVDSTAT